jgi:Domain of unknown function (DUF4145)
MGLRISAISPAGQSKVVVHMACPKCLMPSAALLRQNRPAATNPTNILQTSDEITAHGWAIENFWPEVPGPEIPDLLPPDVSRIYLQAERNFPVAGNEEAAGTMYRKALDIGLKIIAPDVTGVLKTRITELVKQNKLTPSLGEWADQIRLLGNDTAHEIDQPTREELTALRNFSDLVLRYLFTLPKMVEARKAPISPPEKPQN